MRPDPVNPPALVRPAAGLAELFGVADREHAAVIAKGRESVEHARACGEALARAQDQCQREGKPWLATLKARSKIHERTARNYLLIFREWERVKSETVSDSGVAAVLNYLRDFGQVEDGEGPAPTPPVPAGGCTTEDLRALTGRGARFGTVYADPPWRYGNQATRAATDNHYPTMGVEEIAALPVAELAAPASHLHLWATVGFLPEALDVLRAWGFDYRSQFIWEKPQMGLGNYWRLSHEILLLGVRGGCRFRDKGLRSCATIPRGRHSAKPEQVRAMIERASPGPRLELFGRLPAPGWTVWGNEIGRELFSTEELTA